jgi:hypothetical protein
MRVGNVNPYINGIQTMKGIISRNLICRAAQCELTYIPDERR